VPGDVLKGQIRGVAVLVGMYEGVVVYLGCAWFWWLGTAVVVGSVRWDADGIERGRESVIVMMQCVVNQDRVHWGRGT